MYNKYENKVIGYLNNKIVHYDRKDGYAIEIPATGIRNPTHKELRQIKAKFGGLEKKLKWWLMNTNATKN